MCGSSLRNPCQNGGTCVDGNNSFTCNCSEARYQGQFCEIDGHFCDPNPCRNGGTCTNPGDAFCLCPVGVTGRYCEVDENECDHAPCLNGAGCFNSYASYSCDCPSAEYTGKNCQIGWWYFVKLHVARTGSHAGLFVLRGFESSFLRQIAAVMSGRLRTAGLAGFLRSTGASSPAPT